MARQTATDTNDEPREVLQIAEPLGLLRRLLQRPIDPATGEARPAPLERLRDGSKQATWYALIFLAIQVALNIYGIPTPISVDLNAFQQNNQAAEISPHTPEISKANASTPTEGQAGSVAPGEIVRLPPGPPGPDMSTAFPPPAAPRPRIGGRIADNLKLLLRGRESQE